MASSSNDAIVNATSTFSEDNGLLICRNHLSAQTSDFLSVLRKDMLKHSINTRPQYYEPNISKSPEVWRNYKYHSNEYDIFICSSILASSQIHRIFCKGLFNKISHLKTDNYVAVLPMCLLLLNLNQNEKHTIAPSQSAKMDSLFKAPNSKIKFHYAVTVLSERNHKVTVKVDEKQVVIANKSCVIFPVQGDNLDEIEIDEQPIDSHSYSFVVINWILIIKKTDISTNLPLPVTPKDIRDIRPSVDRDSYFSELPKTPFSASKTAAQLYNQNLGMFGIRQDAVIANLSYFIEFTQWSYNGIQILDLSDEELFIRGGLLLIYSEQFLASDEDKRLVQRMKELAPSLLRLSPQSSPNTRPVQRVTISLEASKAEEELKRYLNDLGRKDATTSTRSLVMNVAQKLYRNLKRSFESEGESNSNNNFNIDPGDEDYLRSLIFLVNFLSRREKNMEKAFLEARRLTRKVRSNEDVARGIEVHTNRLKELFKLDSTEKTIASLTTENFLLKVDLEALRDAVRSKFSEESNTYLTDTQREVLRKYIADQQTMKNELTELMNQKARLERLNGTNQELTLELESARAEINAAKGAKEVAESHAESRWTEIQTLEGNITTLNATIVNLRSRIDELQQQQQQPPPAAPQIIQQQPQGFPATLDDSKTMLEALKQHIEDLEKQPVVVAAVDNNNNQDNQNVNQTSQDNQNVIPTSQDSNVSDNNNDPGDDLPVNLFG